MTQQIYKSWKDQISKRFWIEERFTKNSYDEMMYNSFLKTMRYISYYIQFANNEFKQELKNDLKECREYYLKYYKQ